MCRLTHLLFLLGQYHGVALAKYDPTWNSLDTRPLPPWYDGAKIGIFLHWGVFSVPSFGSEWFWQNWQGSHGKQYVEFMKENYRPGFTYQDFAPQFTAEFYDPEEWASIFNASGARYVVLTSKHHEGFTNWPSKYSWNWNSMDVGPKRDLLGDLAKAIRSKTPKIHFGLYHSLYEWFHPLYLQDKTNEFQTSNFVKTKTMPELYELVNDYQPEVVWSDGDWETEDWYWNSTVFLAWLFNDSPVKDTVVVNDRWGRGIPCHHGSYYTCTDRYNPGVLQPHKWENCMTLDRHSWGYRRNSRVADYLTPLDLITEMAMTISCGGNILINAGPTHDGRIPPIMEERLRQLGSWLNINGDAVYDSRPWIHQNDSVTPGVWFTSKGDEVFAIVLSWPKNDVLNLGSVVSTPTTHLSILGYHENNIRRNLHFKSAIKRMQVVFPPMSDINSQWAWVVVMSGVKPASRPSLPPKIMSFNTP
ncbi:alpha-L-fucosidase-like isoform X1 [Homarus americanus]|uniref:alpha-L-fucosidase-like isoform X1 n=1 Tax=Homarus americanus TaxID=6706 RepID=UPI001C47BC17|nr:alpha-L-fucosidase-like isoform X1 [Homarus americanus]